MIVAFTEISILVISQDVNSFSKFRAPQKGLDETCYLVRSYPELLWLQSMHNNEQMCPAQGCFL